MTMGLSLQSLLQFDMGDKEDQETKTDSTGQIITGHHHRETCHLVIRAICKEMDEAMLRSRIIVRLDLMEGVMVHQEIGIFLLE